MPYYPPLATAKDTQLDPHFVVFSKGNVIAKGNAKQLQQLFNQRHRPLKQRLLLQSEEAEDLQMQRTYQVLRLAVWEEDKRLQVAHVDHLLAEDASRYVRPECLLEEELLFNPNDQGLKNKIASQTNRYRRYYRKHYVARWKAREDFPAPEEVVLTIGDQTLKVPSDTESMAKAEEQLELDAAVKTRRAAEGEHPRDKWTHRKTREEREHLGKRQERLAKHQPASIWY
jgi:hypothetical protein